nr:TetR/AcrR family transcriptional regulator [uncultured Roseococcus sp.]
MSKEKAAENRARILSEAGRLFRERGIAGTGVDALAEAAGLTHGSLYSQFGSKEQLAVEALAATFRRSRETHEGKDFAAFLDHYLSPRHRDAIGQGCGIAALCADMPRGASAVRSSFTGGVRGFLDSVGTKLASHRGEAETTEEERLAAAASLVGALLLARAVDDPELSDRLLAATKRQWLASPSPEVPVGPGEGQPAR